MLLDTNIFIDHLRKHAPAIHFFESISDADDVIFSAITEAELIAGKECADARKKEFTLHFLHRWEKIMVTNPIAVLGGDLCRDYGLALPDALIAATALVYDAEFLTKNIKHFQMVPKLKIRAPY